MKIWSHRIDQNIPKLKLVPHSPGRFDNQKVDFKHPMYAKLQNMIFTSTKSNMKKLPNLVFISTFAESGWAEISVAEASWLDEISQ